VVTAGAVGALVGCSDDDPTDAMADDLDQLSLPDQFRFEAERRHAADECQEPCPSVAHYYSSLLEPAAACTALAEPIEAWADDVATLPDITHTGSVRCGFEGTTGAGLVTVSVFPDTEIESGVGNLHTERIETPHASVVRITINS
jgi:hypothetical protein